MLSEFNSLLFYVFAFGGSSYLIGFIRQNQRNKSFFYYLITFCALAIPVIIAGYRSCGSDTIAYIWKYVRIEDTPWEDIFDFSKGFTPFMHNALTKLLRYVSHPRIYLSVFAILTLYPVYKVSIYIKNDNIAMCMLLYYLLFFVYSLNGMRQYVAIALIAFSFKFIFEKKLIPYILTVFLAATFHPSAALTGILYLLWTKKNKLVTWVLIIPLLIATLVIGLNLESLLSGLSEMNLTSSTLQRYSTYTDALESKNRDFYLNIFVSFVTLLHYSRLKKVDEKNTFFIVLMLIGTLLGVFGFVSPYAKRISTYFSIAEIWVLSDIPKCYKDHHSIWTARLLVIAYAITRFTVVAYVLGQSHLIPYMWVLPGWAQI